MNNVKIDSPTVLQECFQDIRVQIGLYYLETSMMENDLGKALSSEKGQRMIRMTCSTRQTFVESLFVSLAHHINTPQVIKWIDKLIDGTGVDKHTIYQAFFYECNTYFRGHNIIHSFKMMFSFWNRLCKNVTSPS